MQEFSRAVAASGIPVLDMAANTGDLGRLVAAEIAPKVAEYGLGVPELYIENISLPPAVEEALDKRTSMGMVGYLGRFTQFSAAEAMSKAGQTSGPFSKAALGRMATDGRLTRQTHVWTPGQDGWMHAGDVAELAQLFTVMPPPPPPFGDAP